MALFVDRKFVFVAAMILGLYASQAWSRELPKLSMQERHEQWMARNCHVYRDDAEKARRLTIFKDNVEFIESFNEDNANHKNLVSIASQI